MTCLAASYVRVLQQGARRIEQEVARRTDDLREANLGLESEIERRLTAEQELEAYRDDLERQVQDRTAELNFTSNQLRAIVDSEPECVKLVSAEGLLLDMNPAGLRMIEADSIEQARGLCVFDLVSQADRRPFIELNERVISGESCTLEFEIVGLRGTTRRMETHAVPLVMEGENARLHLAITRDITERTRAERERRALEAQLRHATKLRSVGMLAGGIAHDFNNLLHVIVGNTEVALQSAVDERSTAALEASLVATTEASKLCDQILTYAGESRREVRPVSLPSIVGSMLDLLQVAHSKKVELRIEMEEDLGTIEGDDGQLGQVVVNLVTNASEAIGGESGQVCVAVRAIDIELPPEHEFWLDSAPPPGRYTALVVEDTGTGMSAEELEVIFDPFYTTKFTGRGLGLSSTVGVVRGHGGYLNVVSAVGEGSTFTVLFPASSLPLPEQAATPPAANLEFAGCVLVVDDEPLILSVVADELEAFGLRVHTACDGEAALQVFADNADEIDLAILDVTMPKLNGDETAKALRESHPNLGIVFCSGYAADCADERIPGDGFIGFLHKPYGFDELISTLNEAFERRLSAPA